jgi:hypothetical protein
MESDMRIRSVLFLLASGLLIWVPPTMAQKRIYARVNPNTAATNRSADVFDPSSSGIKPLDGRMYSSRSGYAAVLLNNGKVLLAGGYDGHNLNTAEVFDPSTGKFTATANTMTTARSKAAAVLLQDGRAFIIGGYSGNYQSTTEIYTPADDSFASSGSMTASRQNVTATVLANGKVLVTGGFNGSYLNTAELFDPTAATFSNTGNMVATRDGHTATLLSNGKVLLVGGRYLNSSTNNIIFLSSAELYDPTAATFSETGSLIAPRTGHTATLLNDGKVLITGGTSGAALASAEIYDPATGKFTATGAMATARENHGATLLGDGKVLVAGGSASGYLASAEVYDPSKGTFTTLLSTMTVPRSGVQAVTLKDGRVLLAGGQNTSLITFDVNDSQTDNVPPNMIFSADSKTGFVPYAGSGLVLAFSTETGDIIKRITTGGKPSFLTLLKDGKTLAAVSVLEGKIFIVGMDTLTVKATYNFSNALFGFGSLLVLSPDGTRGYISSSGTGEVIKFDTATGTEIGRLKGLQTPGQLSVTPDGGTLVVVDITKTELVFADTNTLTAKYRMTPSTNFPLANFTAANKPVLSPDGATGVIGSQNLGSSVLSKDTLFLFKTSTGEILATPDIGYQPGYTSLSPDGKYWVVLNQFSIALVPTNDPASLQDVATVQGEPLPGSTIAFSPDSRYVFYPASNLDYIFQQEISSTAVIGEYQVGDAANVSVDQASSVAITPNGKTIAVVNFMSDEIDLLTDSAMITLTRYANAGMRFTGLTLLNTSPDKIANVVLTAYIDNGATLAAADNANPNLVNPVYLQIWPNQQVSKELSTLLVFDPDYSNIGRLEITADLTTLTGFATLGQIRPTWFGYYLARMDGLPLAFDQAHEWIVPELGDSVEIDFINSNYNSSDYTLARFAPDGSVLEAKSATTVTSKTRSTVTSADVIAQSNQKKVILFGGSSGTASLNTADLFDPATSGVSATAGAMNVPRFKPSVSQLRSGKVLLTGGKNATALLNNGELWDPLANSFTMAANNMNIERFRHTSTRLNSGFILLAGGQNSTSVNRTAELYDPLNDSFTYTSATMNSPRDGHTANLLSGGQVLLAGGIDGNAPTATAELYNPVTSTFTVTGSMISPRTFHCSATLADGRVLVAGGYNGSALNTAEIYDPSNRQFTATGNMVEARTDFACTTLNDGTVLLVGGTGASGVVKTAEIYNPVTGKFQTTYGSMSEARSFHTATLIVSSGLVLVTGGTDGTNTSKTIETYDPNTQLFTLSSAELGSTRQGHAAIYLQPGEDGYLRISSTIGLNSAEFFESGNSGAAFPGIEVSRYAGVQYLYSPQFAIVPGFSTILNLVNGNQGTDAEVRVTLHRPDGSVLGAPARLTLRKNSQIKDSLFNIFGNDPIVWNSTGWLEVYSSTDRVVGTVSFTNLSKTFLATFELSSRPMKDLLFPLAPEDGVYQTAVAMLNLSGQTANVRLELWGPEGAIVRAVTATLSSGSRTALYLSDYFPGLSPQLMGNIRVHSDQPLHSFSLVHDRMLNFMTAVPPTPIP